MKGCGENTMENACEGLLRNHLTQFIRQQTSKPGLMTKPASDSDKPGVILVIGSCASENVLIADKVIELGQKHFVRHTERWGGGGLNYTFRLIKTGHPVLPILSVGDDWSGNKMREEIKRMTKENIRDREVAQQVIRFVEGKDFFCKGISTQQSFVVVAPSQYHGRR